MTTLPPNLRPWSATLQALVPDLALALGPLIQRLDALVGPMGRPPDPGGADPDGYDGLSRRGPYERLSLTEWVLADEIPDEFLRRAVMGEHLFLELDRRTPRTGRQCVVGFDGGPDQLGSARIGQLALLVVLARRAAEAGATLRWGVLQSPPELVRTGLDGPGVRTLLVGRSATDPTADQLDPLRDGPLGIADELWLVGGRTIATFAPKSAWGCRIDEDWLSDDEALDVAVTRPGGAPRRVRLPLPPNEQRVRLIRDPLVPREAPPPRAVHPSSLRGALVADLRFSPEGQRLLAREEGGAILAFRVDGGSARRPGRHEVPAGHEVLATGWSHQTLTSLIRRTDGKVMLHSGSSSTEIPALAFAVDGPTGEILQFRKPGWAVFRDGASTLWRVNGQLEQLGTCLAFTRRDGALLSVRVVENGTHIEWTTSHQRRLGELHVERGDMAHIGPSGGGIGVVALHVGLGRWRTVTHPPAWFNVAVHEWVWGVTLCPHRKNPALLVGTGRALVLRMPADAGPGADRVLYEGSVLTACSSAGADPRVAWMTADRTVVVSNLFDQQPILEIHPP